MVTLNDVTVPAINQRLIGKRIFADNELDEAAVVKQYLITVPVTMPEIRLGGILKLWDRDILQDAGKGSAELAKAHTESEFEKYRIAQDRLFEGDFDRVVKELEARRLAVSDESTRKEKNKRKEE